ncbi:hypothetical protein [Dyadobacter sp. CY356]|uniref:hypothetical protein n=1 Tax=Dyadobacter sp. CY356 TaxID=2906442 RepID=UPI001F3AEAEE|nr:hypothetical protein [Dyadobacter sp. CY356]MCF0059204.1 hypothetical protein [Dyadobacter sp. CY356]
MQIKLYSLFILSFIFLSITSKAQELFPKKELYHVWILAEQKLDAGQFDDALRLYNTHKENLSFAMKIRQTGRIKEISSEAERLRKRGNYAEAVDKYKEYRKLKDVPTLGIFEKKIEECLTQINKGKLTELTVQQRVITGFEWAHRGREKLSLLDTIGAKRDFNNARILGGNRNNILREQYIEGNRITEALANWGQAKLKFDKVNHTKVEELAFLTTYRDIRNVDIPEVELEIKALRAEMDGQNSLGRIAKVCDTDLLLSYVNNHKENLPVSSALIARLNEFKSTQKKINLLKANKDNAATVNSAYESLLTWTEDFPEEIRDDIKFCIDSEYKSYKATIPEKASLPSTSCSGLADYLNGIVLIRRELSNCNSANAQVLWKKNVAYIKECRDSRSILSSNKSLKDSVFSMVKNDSLLAVYRVKIQNSVQAGNCSETTEIYKQMKSLRVCNQDVLDEEIETGLAEAKNCQNKSWWRPELTGSFARNLPKYSIAGVARKMGNGWSSSAGAQFTFIDHKNPVDFTIGVEYFNTNYYSEQSAGSVMENFTLSGANALVAIKLHKPNTNPDKIRPYLKIGTEMLIPTSYEYESFSVFQKVSGTEQLKKTMLSVTGAFGLEIQKKHFGAFAEVFGNYGLGNSIYNSSLSHVVTAQNQKVEARIVKFGLRFGIRLW